MVSLILLVFIWWVTISFALAILWLAIVTIAECWTNVPKDHQR